MVSLKQHEIATSVPGSFIWNAESLWSRQDWKIRVPEETIDHFCQATKRLSVDNEFLNRYENGSLKNIDLEQLAAQIHRELWHGSGVVWLQGIPTSQFTTMQLKLFYLAIGSAMGQCMDNYGRLYDVRDHGGSYKTQRIPVSQTRSATGFHTDSSARDCMPDLVALLCIQPAPVGGESLVVSGAAAHEQLRSDDPGALTTLYREFVRDIVTPGSGKTLEALIHNRFPVFSQGLYGPGLSFRYMRYWIEKGHEEADIGLANADMAALDTLDQLLESPPAAARFKLQAGDQLWVNNHIVAHNRTAYEEDTTRPRHFVRMWIANSDT